MDMDYGYGYGMRLSARTFSFPEPKQARDQERKFEETKQFIYLLIAAEASEHADQTIYHCRNKGKGKKNGSGPQTALDLWIYISHQCPQEPTGSNF
jgi:hypothetical protein